jgi:tetratricopeptide (TPR) repeat protein
MNKNSKQMVLSLAAVLVGFGLIFVLSNFVKENRPLLPESYADEDLALQGKRLKGFSLGFEGLIADWYWMQSLQYIGDKVTKSQGDINLENLQPLNPRLLYPLLDNATDLDPQFMTAYSYGAVVLPAINPEQAIKIAEKGIANNPQDWRLYQHLGYIYWRLQNYEKAAEVYAEGAKIEGAPAFLQMMTAQMKNQGGSRDTARAIYEQMYRDAQDAQTKENAQLHLLKLDSLDERDAIQPALEEFRKRNNRCAANWNEMFPFLRNLKTARGKNLRFDAATFAPVDPTNVPYTLQNNNRCDVTINFQTSKIPAQ